MNAPEKNLRICVAPGVYLLRAAPAKTRASARQAALVLLTAMRRTIRGRAEEDSATRNLAETIRRRFRPLSGVDLRMPVREPMREPPKPGKRAGK